jgi:threonine dehydrogenase-like Zn-dependent dehydrogenase
MALARKSGAHYVFDYKRDDIAAEISKLTGGRGADLVFDATYSEPGFVETAKMVRRGGNWVVLGVGPGKTTRIAETESPVDSSWPRAEADLGVPELAQNNPSRPAD